MSQSREAPEPFVRHGDQLDPFLQSFWQRQVDAAESDPPPYGRHPPLPLARIKKVMKSDPDVRMIASDAPVLFCKACENAHKRRTISKADIAKALAKSDHFDFLIDVVPRDEAERAKTQKLINSGLEAEAAEQAAASANQSSNPGLHAQQQSPSSISHQNQVQQQHPPLLSHPQQPSYQQTSHMGMPHHHNMHGHQVHPHQNQHQPRPHSSMMQQHERNNSGQGSVAGSHISPPPLSLHMAPGGGAGRGPGRPHSLSASSQPPPLIPNASLRSPTTGTHPHSFGQGHSQLHGSQGQGQGGQQQQQSGGNRRSSVGSRMSLSPTIPLSTSRMEPPSTLDIGR